MIALPKAFGSVIAAVAADIITAIAMIGARFLLIISGREIPRLSHPRNLNFALRLRILATLRLKSAETHYLRILGARDRLGGIAFLRQSKGMP